jgi:putative membrane protein
MNRLLAIVSSSAVAFWSVLASADDAPVPVNPMPLPGYGHMWGHGPMGGWGGGCAGPWGGGMLFHPLFTILALIGLIVVVMWLVRLVRHGYGHGPHGYHGYGGMPDHGAMGRGRALDILAERFARGEIGKEEFEEKRKLIGL